jgi:hypothetical protein
MATILTDLSDQPARHFLKPEKAPKEKRAGGLRRSAPMKAASKTKKTKNPHKKVDHKRGNPKQKDRTAITPRVAEEVHERAGGECEMCGHRTRETTDDRLELAHLEQRSQQGRGDQPWNIAALCGPSTKTETCHWKIDSRRKSHRDLVNAKIAELKALYDPADWPE